MPGKEKVKETYALMLLAPTAKMTHLGIMFTEFTDCQKSCTVTLKMGDQVVTEEFDFDFLDHGIGGGTIDVNLEPKWQTASIEVQAEFLYKADVAPVPKPAALEPKLPSFCEFFDEPATADCSFLVGTGRTSRFTRPGCFSAVHRRFSALYSRIGQQCLQRPVSPSSWQSGTSLRLCWRSCIFILIGS
ncbi:hypothetical protein BC828DRAFT_386176 [Blastocladiella britannica]|nr:hypothetical protein BC828DRAFT_386176 [Blastocladiella britannica]